ncbi:MAG: 16S rRNA (cytidine(1402)-2'-O)-methyltransferase [Burkholderiales bacterium]|nr:16S rRNA (cytidine(1402)-2'-O)-methyltransferase [Burkholderiales bacterium]
MQEPDSHGKAELYVVATPIGNLEDITLRAMRVLREAAVVAAEDTRTAARLLSHLGIARGAVALHEHNERAMAAQVLSWLDAGKSVALISEAGTPGICDPGAHLAATARAAGHRVTPVPGPSALCAALSIAGLPQGPVLFCGFLPAQPAARRRAIARLADAPHALVFYEAPHRVLACVEDLASGLEGAAERAIVIARELTKLFETVHTCRLADAAHWLRGDPTRTRGEFVLLVSGGTPQASSPGWQPVLEALLAELPLAQAVRLTCAATGARRNEVYRAALQRSRPGGA